ncbi:hypothetical protein B0H14DRAFT_2898913 [Mycena olivaceomarginata]|nr:hypothetical protein B0H14DRAFT_2898913 [Mycena olivaceomarginata]
MAALSFSDLPPEILSEILGFLDAKVLLLCSSVCKLWHDTVEGSPELQYTIELWADGMICGPSSGVLTHTETLETLHKKRRAWKHLEWTSKTVVEFQPLVFCRAYELVAGLFVQQKEGPDFLATSLPRIVDEPRASRDIYSMGTNLQNFEDFVIDPTQDLIVRFYTPPGELAYLECRTLSFQEPHPLAKNDILAFLLDRDPIGLFSMQVADDIIGIFFLEAPFSFKLFNWRVGITITELRDQEIEIPLPVVGFHLLSPRSYIFAHTSFDLGNAGQIDIYAFDGERVNYPTHIVTLGLPKLLPRINITTLMIQAGPFCAQPISGTPFSKSNDNRIYMVLIRYGTTPVKWYRLFVHYRWFHKYVLDHRRGETKFPPVVPWDEWGPQNSRMLLGENYQWNRHIHGERVALPCPQYDFRAMKILDFGIIPKRILASGISHPLEPTILEQDGVFEDIVTTSLPYTSTVRLLDEKYDLFLLDQDRIIAMDTPDSVTSYHERVTVYTF